MAGRPRLYHSKAQKMQAYRKRLQAATLLVDRWAFEQTDARLQQLMQAVDQAKNQGHSLATTLDTRSRFNLLESLIRHFQDPQVRGGIHPTNVKSGG